MSKELIKLKYSYLDNQVLHQALRALAVQPLTMKTSLKVKRINKSLDKALNDWKKMYAKFLADNAEKNEDGTYKAKVVIDSNGEEVQSGVQMVDEAKADEDFKAIFNEEFSFKADKIHLDDIIDVRLSADHITSIEPFIVEEL